MVVYTLNRVDKWIKAFKSSMIQKETSDFMKRIFLNTNVWDLSITITNKATWKKMNFSSEFDFTS